ncbi:TIGR03905 family TSCPD domain-containing protein [Breznakia pachnodae]|uniref:ribonucleoside-diphosphate reductase n=1 Tax=Breznakia pachnodae TaxID=265178 RepID=A0ABU0E8C7_9FIRM|nr:TIGR03905 family TSCPD domain-containing protein [Breznakia pachnodae]MDQ0363152.1 uncharacterized protein (TIGR03905 family) [Breznakia pachnodae]
MLITYKPQGVCSKEINIEVEDNIVKTVEFVGGCNGNAKGIAALAKGMNVDEVIKRLSGITCGFRQTSCPDQMARALSQSLKEE